MFVLLSPGSCVEIKQEASLKSTHICVKKAEALARKSLRAKEHFREAKALMAKACSLL